MSGHPVPNGRQGRGDGAALDEDARFIPAICARGLYAFEELYRNRNPRLTRFPTSLDHRHHNVEENGRRPWRWIALVMATVLVWLGPLLAPAAWAQKSEPAAQLRQILVLTRLPLENALRDQGNGGKFASINRPIAGARHLR